MVKVKYLMGMALSVALISCGGTGDGFVEENVEFARKQIGKEIELIEASGKFNGFFLTAKFLQNPPETSQSESIPRYPLRQSMKRRTAYKQAAPSFQAI